MPGAWLAAGECAADSDEVPQGRPELVKVLEEGLVMA
jgi:hypothetical protein